MTQELKLRILSGVVLATVVLFATWQGGYAFDIIAAMIGVLVYYEWTTITGISHDDRLGWFAGWLVQTLLVINLFYGHPHYAIGLVAIAVFAAALRSQITKTSNWLAGGIFYAGFSGVSLATLRNDTSSGLVVMLFLFSVVWGTDIAAYFTGRTFGGPKLAPKISPGKTWSGAIGGAVIAMIAGSALIYTFEGTFLLPAAIIALLLSIISQIGDLFESFIKRRFGVKDSSHLIPGHGGVMDRVDGLVFASIAAFLLDAVLVVSHITLPVGWSLTALPGF